MSTKHHHHNSKSSKGGYKSGSSKKHSSSKPESSRRSTKHHGDNRSFLFVINELTVEPNFCPSLPYTGTLMPPQDPQGFSDETPGTVFRYSDGRIEPCQGFRWCREAGPHTPGGICYYAQDEAGNYIPDTAGGYIRDWAPPFQTHSVFDCWRFMPRVFCLGDPTIRQLDISLWCFLTFASHSRHGATSFAGASAGSAVTVGHNRSWNIIPQSFNNTARGAPPSEGLSGEIGLILGLMALTRHLGHIDEIFTATESSQRPLWKGPGHPWLGTSSMDLQFENAPRGVLVHVALDPYNPNSTAGNLTDMGKNEVLVPSPSR